MSGNTYADLNGYGEIKLNQFNVNQFEHYLSDGIHDKNGGGLRYGKGLVFAISLDGADSGYYYCFQGRICDANRSITDTISYCQRNAKKHLGEKKKCRIFAMKRTIVWDGLNKKVPKGVNVKDFLDELGLVSHEVAPTNIDEEQLKQLKSLLDLGIMTQEEYDEAIKAIQ